MAESTITVMLAELDVFISTLESLVATLTPDTPLVAADELVRLEAEFATVEAAVAAARVRVDAL